MDGTHGHAGEILAKIAAVLLAGCVLVFLCTAAFAYKILRGSLRPQSLRFAISVIASAACFYLVRTGYPRFADAKLNTIASWVTLGTPSMEAAALHSQLIVIDMHAGKLL